MDANQLGFTDYELTTAKKRTKREEFLAEMEVVVTCLEVIVLIESHYPKTSRIGGRLYPLVKMMRTHLQ